MRYLSPFCVGFSISLALAASATETDLPGWRADLLPALSQAQTENKFIIVYFTDGQEECRRLEEHTLNFLPVREALQDFVKVRLTVEGNEKLAAAYHVRVFPMVIFFDSQGRELDRFSGFAEWDSLLRRAAEAVSPKTNYVLLKERLKADPGDIDALYYMGYKYTRRSDYDRAANYFRRVKELDPNDEKGFFDNIALREIEELQRINKFADALDRLDAFTRQYSKSDEADVAAVLRARLLMQNGMLRESLDAYETFLKEYPDSLWAPQARASLEALRAVFTSMPSPPPAAGNPPPSP